MHPKTLRIVIFCVAASGALHGIATPAAAQQLSERVDATALVTARLTELQDLEQQHAEFSEAVPITLIILGTTSAAIGGGIAAVDGLCLGFDDDCHGGPLLWGTLYTAGMITLIVGAVWAANGRSEHERTGLQIDRIRAELRNAGVHLGWNIAPSRHGATASVSMEF